MSAIDEASTNKIMNMAATPRSSETTQVHIAKAIELLEKASDAAISTQEYLDSAKDSLSELRASEQIADTANAANCSRSHQELGYMLQVAKKLLELSSRNEIALDAVMIEYAQVHLVFLNEVKERKEETENLWNEVENEVTQQDDELKLMMRELMTKILQKRKLPDELRTKLRGIVDWGVEQPEDEDLNAESSDGEDSNKTVVGLA